MILPQGGVGHLVDDCTVRVLYGGRCSRQYATSSSHGLGVRFADDVGLGQLALDLVGHAA